MKKTARGLLSIFISTLLAVSVSLTTVCTAATNTSMYTAVDLSEAANGKAYLGAGNCKDVPIESNNDFISWGGDSYRHNFAFDRDYLNSKMTDGKLKDTNGVLYKLYDKAISIRGTKDASIPFTKSVNVTVPSGSYSKIHFLAFSTVGSKNYHAFSVRVDYSDGTNETSQVDLSESKIYDSTAQVSGVLTKAYTHWTENKNLGSSVDFNSDTNCFELESLTVTANPQKTLISVTFFNGGASDYANWYEQAKVLALTLEGKGIEDEIVSLSEATEVTVANYSMIAKQVKSVEQKMAFNNLTLSDLSPKSATKLTALKDVINGFVTSKSYYSIDISSVANGKAYLGAGNCKDVLIENNDDFISWGGDSYRHNFAIDRDYLNSQMIDGKLVDERGVVYKLSDKAVSIGGTSNTSIPFTTSVTVDVPDEEYSKIHFLAFSISGSRTYHAFRVRADYTDGTNEITQVNLQEMKAYDATVQNPGIPTKSYIHWEPNKNLGSKTTYSHNDGLNAIETLSVTTNPEKKLTSVTFYNGCTDDQGNNNFYANSYENADIFALTVEGLGVGSLIQALPESELITFDNRIDVQKQVDEIGFLMNKLGLTDSDLKSSDLLRLTAVRNKLAEIAESVNWLTVRNLNVETNNLGNGMTIVAASAEAKNETTVPQSGVVILALYVNDTLKEIEIGDVKTINAGVSDSLGTSMVKESSLVEKGVLKAFVWGNLDTMKPLCSEYDNSGIISSLNSKIKYTGRWVTAEKTRKSYWGGATFETDFTGTTVKLQLGSSPVSFFCEIDGVKTEYTSVSGLVNLAPTALPDTTHNLKVYSKSFNERMTVSSIILDKNAVVSLPAQTKKTIEFIGDSITAGQMETDINVTDSYSWRTAQALGADSVFIAQSGATLVADPDYYYDSGMQNQYFRLDCEKGPEATVNWGFSNNTPDVIVINIGTNDQARINRGSSLTPQQYGVALTSFLDRVRAKYANAQIIVLRPFGGYLAGPTESAVTQIIANGDIGVHYVDTTGWLTETDYYDGLHPTSTAHEKITAALTPILRTYLN